MTLRLYDAQGRVAAELTHAEQRTRQEVWRWLLTAHWDAFRKGPAERPLPKMWSR